MKKWLVGVSVAACLAVAMPSDALAQLPVTDGGNLVAQAKNLLQELKSYATELEQLSQQVQQVTWLAQTAASLIQNPNLGAAMQLMNMVGLENPLPVSPYAVQGLISGYGGMNSVGGIVGKLNSLGSLVTTSYQTDRVYTLQRQFLRLPTAAQTGIQRCRTEGHHWRCLLSARTAHSDPAGTARAAVSGNDTSTARERHGAGRHRERLGAERAGSAADCHGAGRCAAAGRCKSGE